MRIAHKLQFEISEDTQARLVRLLETHPDLSRLSARNGTVAIDPVLEFILAAGITQLDRCIGCTRSTAIEPGSCQYACKGLAAETADTAARAGIRTRA
jgi:hypothetical protein